MNKSFSLISLGCAKNLVNSEQMLRLMTDAGYEYRDSLEDSDLVIINTCGFIDDAKTEAIDTIFEAAQRNENIIVTGCLPQRYKEEIADELPEVKAFLGVGSYGEIVSAAESVLSGEKYSSYIEESSCVDEIPRIVSTGPSWAFLRISEGCNNFCAFCAIPYIRGRYRSRKFENIIDEAKELAEHGVKEIIVVAQDITRYGTDLYGKRRLAELVHEISLIEGIHWIRLHYLYPEAFDDALIDEIAANDKVLKYLDIPIQHINDSILKKMNRHTSGAEIRALFARLRSRIPGLVIRTSLIAGLPGENETEFEELCGFLREARIERAGVFPFSPEEGTPAATMEHCDYETAVKRAELIMTEIQAPIMDKFCNSFISKEIEVLVQYYDEENELLVGRSYADSPDIDGEVCFEGVTQPGGFATVYIESADDGVLYGHEVTK